MPRLKGKARKEARQQEQADASSAQQTAGEAIASESDFTPSLASSASRASTAPPPDTEDEGTIVAADQTAANFSKLELKSGKTIEKMSRFKLDQILVISVGSREIRAQYPIGDIYSPARYRFPARMFPAEKKGQWEPMRVREKKGSGATDEQPAYEEDPTSDEGAVYPIEAGRVRNWGCLYALLKHIHNTISPPFHTALAMSIPSGFLRQDREDLTQFVFETLQPPAFALIDAPRAVIGAANHGTCCVIDVGYDKVDITAYEDYKAWPLSRAIGLPDAAGHAMTQTLHEKLGPKGFTLDMCEQLKKSAICEILPPGTPLPSETAAPNTTSPAAMASTGLNGAGPPAPGTTKPAPSQNGLPRGPGPGTEAGEEAPVEDNEGVLDVATIVASGKTSEFLAKKEREKAEKAAAKKGAADAAARARLPNSQRVKATFYYDAPLKGGEEAPVAETAQELQKVDLQATNTGAGGDAAKPADGGASAEQPEAAAGAVSKKEERRRNRESSGVVRKEIEVGVERFQVLDAELLPRIAAAVHRCILHGIEPGNRAQVWENLILCGPGAKVRGFREALLATLTNAYLISPSSATMFTSELPSNFSTPAPTGANTPLPQAQPTHHASGVNPLLLAATTAQNPALATPGGPAAGGSLHPSSALHTPGAHTPGGASHASASASHHHHPGQTPTAIRWAKLPEYFSEWKEVGLWDAEFLGAQLHGWQALVHDPLAGEERIWMTRADYNNEGPRLIRKVILV